ncbi:TonB-dependent receptor [Granulicella sp. dw_53]|uniref:TonB-dependent receptor n=1 Tax=Granulicella sp. dw_53 TaxID=2719792 RepID=UPI001BD5BCF6|nr:TonB-dependent receptor [Granulicella sp. dw_53]
MLSISKRGWPLPLAVAALSFLAHGDIYAQSTTADILGTVSDQSGAVIPNASVTVENLGTHETRHAVTSSSGEFTFTTLSVGSYSVRVEDQGFTTYQVPSIAIQAGDRRRVDAHLTVGSGDQTVQVNTAPPTLQTDNSTIGSTISNEAVENLPTNGRNFIDLVQLVPGANPGTANSIAGGTRPDDRRLTSAVSINGQSTMVNNEEIDGLDNNERIIGTIGIRPSIDAIQEFRVETNLYTAEVGRTAAGVITILTKSGTNQFHGSAYEFLRNDALDATEYFASSKPPFRQNQFGGSLGGPVLQNKLFFFGDYEGLRIVQGSTSTVTVPTLYQEQHPGDFSDVGGPVIPTAQLNPIGLRYFALYPAPNKPGTVNNYFSAPKRSQFAHLADGRIDAHINDKNILYGRYSINVTSTNTPGPLPLVNGIAPGGSVYSEDGVAQQQQQNILADYIHIFTPNILLELKAGYTRINNASLPLNFGTNASAQFGLTGVNYNAESSALSPFLPNGYASVGDGEYLPLQDIDNTFQYLGSVSINKGNHSIKIGAGLVRRQATNIQSSLAVGQFSFTGQYAASVLPTCSGTGTNSTNTCGIASMLLGIADQVQRGNQLFPVSYRTWEPSGYIQDNWHVIPNLTLNLGVRYDLFTPYTERNNHLSNFDDATGKLIVAGLNGVSDTAGVATDYSNFAPRFGFALTLPKATVVRGGFGISFFPDNYGTSGDRQNQPFVYNFGPNYNYNISQGLTVPFVDSSQITNPTGSINTAMARNFRNAYMYQMSLTAEKQIGANVISLTYVGNIGRHLAQFIPNIDVPVPQSVVNYTTNTAALQQARPYNSTVPGISSITEVYSAGVSNYNALQAVVQRRITNGLAFNVNYTLAHQLDNSPDLNQSNQAGIGLLPKQISTYDYGNSDSDIRNRVTGTLNYALPFGARSHGIEKVIFSGWKSNALLVWQSGSAFTVQNNNPQINTGVTNDRPNKIGKPNLDNPTNAEYFNVAAFAPQAFGTAGNSPRNVLHGPHFRHFDISAFKEFSIFERATLQFRTEVFNLTNTPSFALPNAALNSNGVGTISSTTQFYTPREIQFALKLLF